MLISFVRLPRDIKYSIVKLLSLPDLLALVCCQKSLLSLMADDKFWYHKFRYDFGDRKFVKSEAIPFKVWYQMAQVSHIKVASGVRKLYGWFSGLDDQVYIDLNTEFRRQRFYDAWPHQTVKEKVLSQIFFPQELKDLNESPSALYFRDHILYRLAYAAKNNDLLALYYMYHCLNFFEQDLDKDEINLSDDELNKQTTTPLDSWRDMKLQFRCKLYKLLEATDINDTTLPYWCLSRIYDFLFLTDEAKTCLESAARYNDPRSFFEMALCSKQNKVDQISELEQLVSMDWPAAFLLLAQIADSMDAAYKLYIKAGENNISEGYHQAALMIKNGFIKNISLVIAAELFERAGDMGRISSYENAASIWESLGCIENARTLYLKQGKNGDPSGYQSLSKLYPSDGDEGMRREILDKMSGPLSFFYKYGSADGMYGYFKELFDIVMSK